MAVAYVNSFTVSNSNTLSASGAGANFLIVFAANSYTSNIDSTACTFNGVAMTKLFAIDKPQNTGWQVAYYLYNPYASTGNVQITWQYGGVSATLSASTFSGVAGISAPVTSSLEKGTSFSLNLGTSLYGGMAAIAVSSYSLSPTISGWSQRYWYSGSYCIVKGLDVATSAGGGVSATVAFGGAESATAGGVILYSSPSAFSLSSPANGATGQNISSTTISWTASSNFTRYDYTIDGGSNWISNGTSTSKVLSGLAAGTTYTWGARAVGASVVNATGNYRTFTTLPVPGAFSKVSPGNGANPVALNASNQVTLTWGASSNVTGYYVRCHTTYAEDSWVYVGNVTSYTVALAHNTTYYWTVIADNPSGQYGWGSLWGFTTNMENPGAFNKSSPGNGATKQPKNITLSWEASTNATKYYYSINGGGSWVDNGTNTSVSLTNLTPKATYTWTAYATNNSGTIVYANGGGWWTFTVIADAPTFGAGGKSSPTNGANKQLLKPTLSWTTATDTTSYEYRYSLTSQGGSWTSNGTNTSITISDFLLYNKAYYWQVRAIGEGGTTYANGTIADEWSFSTIVPPIHYVVII